MRRELEIKQKTSFISSFILFITLVSCQNLQKDTSFQLEGKSELRITNQSAESIQVSISNWLNLPMHEEKIDSIVAPNQYLVLSINTQSKHYFNLSVNGKTYRVFTTTGKVNEVTILANKDQIDFAGELSEINNFLKTRSIDSDWLPRGPWFQGKGSISDLSLAYDSITIAQQKQLDDYAGLPQWYRKFERSRLDYVNAESKLSALGYRIKMLSFNDTIPDKYLNHVVGDLPVERSDFIGVTAYMRFINWYLTFKKDPRLEAEIAISKEEWISYAIHRIKVIEENIIDQNLKDAILAEYFTGIIDRHRHIWDDKWLQHIKDPTLSDLVKQQILANPILTSGEELPYFYLSDLDSTFYEPENFVGKILLINFWATWCKPCYEEFEHENRLVERFKDEPVEFVNICIESEYIKWKEVVNKYELKTKNIYATPNWSEKINKDFGTTALPHSILIDWNGNVIQNKCPRASAGVDKLIVTALNEMKKEADI